MPKRGICCITICVLLRKFDTCQKMIKISRLELSIVRWAIHHPNEYLGTEESQLVAGLILSVNPRVVVEFGVNLGKTARLILDASPAIEHYLGIDVPPDHDPRLAVQRNEIPKAAAQYVLGDSRFQLLYRESTTLQISDLPVANAVFIDGDHSAIAVRNDSLLARAIITRGGIIVWHDYANPVAEVTEVLDQFVADGWPIQHIEGTWLAFLRI